MDIGGSFDFGEMTDFVNYSLPKFEEELQNTVYDEVTLLNKMKQKGGVVTGETGDYIIPKFLMGKNDSVSDRQLRSEIPLRGQDLTRFGKEDFGEYSGGIAIDYVTSKKNSGSKEAVINYFETEYEALEKTLVDTINQALMTGSGSYPQLNGMTNIIKEDPTSGTLHEVPLSSNTFARNQYEDSSCDTEVGFGSVCIRELSELAKKAAPGQAAAQNNMFNLALMDDQIYSYAMYYLPNVASAAPIMVKDAEEGQSFANQSTFYIADAEAMWDHAAPADSIRLFNTKYVKLHVVKDCNFKVLPRKWARDSFNSSIVMGFVGCLVNHNPTRSAVLFNFSS